MAHPPAPSAYFIGGAGGVVTYPRARRSVPCLPQRCDRRASVPREAGARGCELFITYCRSACLRACVLARACGMSKARAPSGTSHDAVLWCGQRTSSCSPCRAQVDDLPQHVNQCVLRVIKYCASRLQSDCLPLVELLAECLDYNKILYREHGAGDAGAGAADEGDTRAWRQSLDFADHVDAIKVDWDGSKSWATAQIVETNPAVQKVKLHFDNGYEDRDRWVTIFSDEIAPHQTKTVQAAAKLKQWKESLVVGAPVDVQDYTLRNWHSGVVHERKEAAEYAQLQWQQHATAAHIRVAITVEGREEPDIMPHWISVDAPRLARSGTRAGGAAAHFDDLDDSDDPDDPAIFACDRSKTYGCPSLVVAVNTFGQAGGFGAIVERLLAAGCLSAESESFSGPEPEPEAMDIGTDAAGGEPSKQLDSGAGETGRYHLLDTAALQSKLAEKQSTRATLVEMGTSTDAIDTEIRSVTAIITLRARETLPSNGGQSGVPEREAASVPFLISCVDMLVKTRMLLAKPFAARFVPEFCDALRANIQHISDDQVRAVSAQVQERLMDGMKQVLERLYNSRDITQATGFLQLDLALKCFRCPWMTEKILGFKSILEIVDKARWTKTGWVSTQWVVDWLLRERVPEDIFDGPLDLPIVERSADVMKLLSQEKKLTQQHLEMIWQCSLRSTDEADTLAIYKLLKDMAQGAINLHQDDLEFIFAQIDAIPRAQLVGPTVILVFDLAKSSAYKAPALAVRALSLLWDWMVDDSQTSAAIATLAETKLVDLAAQVYSMKDQKEPLMAKCTEFLARSDSSPQCLKVLWKVADTLQDRVHTVCTDQRTKKQAVEHLQQSHDLLGVFFEDFLRYKRRAAEYVPRSTSLDRSPSATASHSPDRQALDSAAPLHGLDDCVVCSRMPHLQQIELRLDVLTFVLRHSSLELSAEQISILWDACVADMSVSDTEREKMYSWLTKACDAKTNTKMFTVMDDSAAAQLFATKMSNAPAVWYERVTPEGFKCFTRFYILANESLNNVVRVGVAEANYGAEFAFQLLKDPPTLQGADCLWRILLHASSDKVVRLCTKLLNDTHESLASEMMSALGDIRRRYIDTCMSHLKRQLVESDTRGVGRCVALLETLISRSEMNGTCGLKSHRSRLRSEDLQIRFNNLIKASILPQKLNRTVQTNMTVWDLRVMLAEEATTVMPEQIRLLAKSKEISFTANTKTLAQVGLQDTEVVSINMRKPPPKPKALLVDSAKQMVPVFKDIVQSWFREFAPSGMMTRQECAAFIRSCRNDTCQWDDARIQAVYREYDTDNDDLLREEDFVRIYQTKASTYAGQQVVWDNLESRGWGYDLNRKAEVYIADPEEDERQKLLLPRYLLIQNADHFDLLLQLLDLGGETLEKVWGLVMNLPTQEAVLNGLTDLSSVSDDGHGWAVLLDPHSPFRLLYALQVVGSLIHIGDRDVGDSVPAAVHAARDWHKLFLSKGGFQHVHSLVMTGAAAPLQSSLHRQCIATLLRVERHFVLGALTSDALCIQAQCEPEPEVDAESDDDDTSVSTEVLPLADDSSPSTEQWLQKPNSVIACMCSGLLDGVDLEALQSTIVDLIIRVTSDTVKTEDASIVQNALQLWVGAVMNSQSLLESFLQLSTAKDFVLGLMFCPTSQTVRFEFSQAIELMCARSKANPTARVWFLQLLLESIPDATTEDSSAASACCEEFFELLCKLVSESSTSEVDFDVAAKITLLMQQLQAYPYTETMSIGESEPDLLLVGIMTLTGVLLDKESSYMSQHDLRPLLESLFNNGLFDSRESLQQDPKTSPPRFKSEASRGAAYCLLWDMAKHNREVLQHLWKSCFMPLQAKFLEVSRWDYNPSLDTKSQTGFVGLRNLGCTCYMNAMLQQFYMVENMRYGVLSVESNEEEKLDVGDSVLANLQRIFGFLDASDRQDGSTVGMCAAYKDMDGNPVNVNVQQDAQEFLNFFFEKIESRLKGTPQEKLLDRLFGGTFADQLRSTDPDAPFFRQKKDMFTSLSLDVQHQKSLHASLSKYVGWDGISDYRIEETGKVADVQKRICLDDLPRTMVIHLKRFVLSFETFVTEKINDEFEFPTRLNVEPYTAEGLARREAAEQAAKKREQDSTSQDDSQVGDAEGASTAAPVQASAADHAESEQTDDDMPPPAHPLEYYEYDLVGVVVHSGNADSGHYYSFIKQRDTGAWLRFDDSIVSEFDPKDLPEECFGGIEQVRDQNQYGYPQTLNRERVKNAYMLVYDRVWKEAGQDPAETAQELQIRRDLAQDIKQDVWQDNNNFFFERRVYHPDFFDFATKLVSQIDIPDVLDYDADLKSAPVADAVNFIASATKFALETVSRAQENAVMPKLIEHICALYARNLPASKLFLEKYTAQIDTLTDLILRCPDRTVRCCVQKLLTVILGVVATAEKKFWTEQETVEEVVAATAPEPEAEPEGKVTTVVRPRSRVQQFMEAFAKLLPTVEKMWLRFEQYWMVWHHWCERGDDEAEIMLKCFGVWRLVDIYLGDRSPLPPYEGQQKIKMGKLNCKPVFGPMLSCICTLTILLIRKHTADLPPDSLMAEVIPNLDYRDGMLIQRRELFDQALKTVEHALLNRRNKSEPVYSWLGDHAPENVGAMACCLAKCQQEFTDMLIGKSHCPVA